MDPSAPIGERDRARCATLAQGVARPKPLPWQSDLGKIAEPLARSVARSRERLPPKACSLNASSCCPPQLPRTTVWHDKDYAAVLTLRVSQIWIHVSMQTY